VATETRTAESEIEPGKELKAAEVEELTALEATEWSRSEAKEAALKAICPMEAEVEADATMTLCWFSRRFT